MPGTAYGDHPDQVATLSLPEGEAPAAGWPVAAVVHGGFWVAANGSAARMEALCADLAGRGWAAWNVEYRRLGPGSDGGWPRTAEDVAAAIDHLARLAGLDLTRVVSIGHSAGGHLTLLDAARTGARVRVAATVAQAPVTDVAFAHAMGGEGAAVVEAFMGGTPDARPAEYAAASPVRRLPLGVPALVVQGAKDPVVPGDMVAAFAAEAGAEAELVVVPGAGHFDHLEPGSACWAAVTGWLALR